MAVDPMTARLAELPADPQELLAEWLPSNAAPDRPLMTLSTIGEDGEPDSRNLLLSEYGPEGFWFHTDTRSAKVAQLAARPGVSLALVWTELRRQILIRGRAEPADAEEQARAYRARNPYLQELAWMSTEEFARRDYSDRVAAWAAWAAAHPEPPSPPATWTGYLVRPSRIVFWRGSADTASRRVEYERTADGAGWDVSVHAG